MKPCHPLLLLYIFTSLLTGCSTSYQPDGWTGGFEETQLDVDLYEITFSGNGYTSEKRASDFVLLRAAELSLLAGYPYFRTVDNRNWSKTSRTKRRARTTCNEVFGQQQCNTSYSGGYDIDKPRSSRTVELLKYKPPSGRAYSAKFVYQSITEKYDIERNPELLRQPLVRNEKSGPSIIGTYRLQYTDYANRASVFRVFPQGYGGGYKWVKSGDLFIFSADNAKPEDQKLYALKVNPKDGSLSTSRSNQVLPKWNVTATKISNNPNAEFDLFELGSNKGERRFHCFNVGRNERPHGTIPLNYSVTSSADTLASCKALCPSVMAWRESRGYPSPLSDCP